MAANKAVLTLIATFDEEPATLADRFITKRPDYRRFVPGLFELFGKAGGITGTKVTAWVDSASGGTSDNPGQAFKTVSLSVDTHGSVSNGDTLSIGDITITWGSSNDVDQGADADAAVTNLASYINGLAALKGVCEATADTSNDNCDIKLYGPPRLLELIPISESSGGTSIAGSATDFSLDTTDSTQVDPITVRSGLA
jgi:hypothetical protein